MIKESQFGKYTLIRLLGRGGMGEVYLAQADEPEGVKRQVVIKRIHPSFSKNSEFIKMFIDEARISVLLGHGNIVPVFDFGKIGNVYYMAMEYVDGLTLWQLLLAGQKSQRRLAVELALFITIEIAKGLHHAHQLKDSEGRPLHIVHRDISPQNVMISFEGEVKLLDFGIARAVSRATRTDVNVIKGKYCYLSPEQVHSQAIDARSDLFSLGILLYEMVTGVNPFYAENAATILHYYSQGV